MKTKPSKISKILSLFLVCFLVVQVLAGLFWFPHKALAVTHLTEITATPANVTSSTTTGYTIAFKTSTAIPADGKIAIEFPAGFDVSSAGFDSWTGFDGGESVSITDQVITVTRDGNGSSSSAGSKTIILSNITNIATTGNEYQVTVTTKDASDTTLDGPTGSIYFQIFDSHSETNIDGLYYIRDDPQTHYQNRAGAGSGNDIGTLSRNAPSVTEIRRCGAWVEFHFDENGTYIQTYNLNNIYYHLWWKTDDDLGTLGYDKTGTHYTDMTASFAANASTTVDNYHLAIHKQAMTEFIVGNAIYNLFIKLFATSYPTTVTNPHILSSPNQPSFVIFNLSDDLTLQGQDSDSDGLNDYEELFTHYTNPYDSDTDDDSYSDQYEINNSMNPNDPQRAPIFGQILLKQYKESGSFGYSVSSIGDIDGDGKDDVLVGADTASPDGKSYAGSTYIYSSNTGNLLKQFDGEAASDFFGYSVSSIGDIDGDGKDDVLVGADRADPGGVSNAGSAYIYSSNDGSILQQFDGASADDKLGNSVSSIGDIDGDGNDDVLVGAYLADPDGKSDAGSVYVYSSNDGSILQQFDGASAGNKLGYSISSIGDVDGDGKDDILAGAYGNSRAYLYSSNSGSLLREFSVIITPKVSSIGDIDGDGKDDVLIGSYAADPDGKSDAGSAYIYSSNTGNLLKQFDGEAASDFFGYSVSSIGDIDGDGKDDILVSAYKADPDDKSDAGSVYVYSSNDGSLLQQFDGETISSTFGFSISSIGDIDEDGSEEVIIGAQMINKVYIYSVGHITDQSWSQGSSNNNAFDLDYYFSDPNNNTTPNPNQTTTYSASTGDNPFIDVSIADDGQVAFSQSAEWAGSETVTFTATDPYSLSTNSNQITLTVTGSTFLNAPTIGTPQVNSTTAITWNWTDNSEIEDSYRVDYVSGVADDVDGLATNSSSWQDTDLSPNTQYSVHVHSYRSDSGESAASAIASAYTLAPNPASFSSSATRGSIALSVDSFPNATAGSSGYYFYRTDDASRNSGWIQTNSWSDTGLTCDTTYNYSVKYRNGDSVESSAVSLSKRTDPCVSEKGSFDVPSKDAPRPPDLPGFPELLVRPDEKPTPPGPSTHNPEGGFNLMLNGGANETLGNMVKLFLFASPTARYMMVSEDPNFKGAVLERYSPHKHWYLSSGYGEKTVYVKYFTLYDVVSDVFSQSILRSPPPQLVCTTTTVQAGDSLWSIANRLFEKGYLYFDLISLNKDAYPSLESNPQYLKVGWQLKTECHYE